MKNSLCFSLFHKDRQIGLIRVITDCATFAYLCDVIIDEKYRHKGLEKWCLATKDAHEFYNKFGFTNLNNPERFMEIFNG